jgi:hypothetical protein
MRQQSKPTLAPTALLAFITFAVSTNICLGQKAPPPILQPAQTLDQPTIDKLQKFQACVPKSQAGYRDHTCRVQIWRTNPISPVTMIVPKGTNIYVELFDARQNENVTFNMTAGLVAPHDIGAAAVQNAIPGLQTIIATKPLQTITQPAPAAAGGQPQFLEDRALNKTDEPSPIQGLTTQLEARQNEISTSTNLVLTKVQSAAAAMTCLSNYEKLIEIVDKPFTCSQATMLTYDTFGSAKQHAITLATDATAVPLRILDVSDLDAVIKSFYLTCLGYFPNMGQDEPSSRSSCRTLGELLSTKEALLDTAITDIQKAQDTLIQNVQTLAYWDDSSPTNLVYEYTTQANTNLVITVAGTEVVSKSANPIATVTINVTATPWVVSAGLEVSSIKNKTYAPVPAYSMGAPVLNNGVAEVTVGGTASDFSFIAPLGLLSFRLNSLSHWDWETKCPNSCALLLSAGVGANLTSKTAEFAAGPSFQIGGVLITPTVHWGRDTRLSDGFYVNEPLGTGAPSTLPTNTAWVTKMGIALTYAIPIP